MKMYGNVLLTACCCTLLLGSGVHAQEKGGKDMRIGVYDVNRAGGQGSSVTSIVRRLKKEGWRIESFDDLSLISLVQYDVVYLSDMHKAGPSPKDGRQNVIAYVEAGGSVLQTWHHHFLGAVSTGVKRVYGKRSMIVKTGHPAVAGIVDFQAAYKDHIVEKVGSQGTVILENEDGQPVATAGKIGKGKVVSTGLSLNIPRITPRELKLTNAFLKWLKPDISRRERMGLLREPQIVISPEEALVPAGLPLTFRVMVGPVKDGDACVVLLDGKPLALTPTDPGSILRRASFLLSAPAGRDSENEHEVVVKLAGETMSRKLLVKGIFAPAPPNEKRGVWLHVGRDRHPSVVMPELKRLGINMAVLRIAGGTAAFYASKVQPDVQDPLAKEGGDWLADAVKYAHANGIEIHPYVNNCVVEGRTSKKSLKRLREQGRLQEGANGNPIDWFCPSQPENLVAMTRPMVEIVANYDIDGIQYDFIRYPNSQGCFCAKCRTLFEKETG
ncbi:MAG: family 10 glycosylhydrolase, partial [Lentisphaeria bacterium]|nr:family 10 glycosylhydrolase [Lentisphaeria bacterium]